MYEDDRYSPTDANEYDEVNVNRNAIKALEDLNKSKKNLYSFQKNVDAVWKGKFYKSVKISYYGSGISGTRIRDAITGVHSKFIVGRYADESNFFKVVVATGQHPGGPVHLFYNTPEEYENHQFVDLDATTKEKWYNRNV
jgi:hypothetical protein